MRTFITPLVRTILIPVVAGAFVLATSSVLAQQQEKPPTQGSGAAKVAGVTDANTFIKEAAQANASEIALAQVAETKAQNPEVKKLAADIRKDHTEANQKLAPIAQAHGVSIAGAADPQIQKKVNRLQQLSGEQFDKEFVKDMLKGNKQAITKFENAAQQIPETDVKQYAQSTLPTLRENLESAKQTAKAIGLDDAAISGAMSEPAGMGGAGDASESSTGAKGSQGAGSSESKP